MEVKDIIKKRREELSLTYEQLGNMVGVGKSTVRKWETGLIENMRRDNIVALSKALNISPAIIMGWQPIEDNNKLILSKEETILIKNYNKLNDLGKSEANKRVAELTEINKYVCEAADEISATKTNITELFTTIEKNLNLGAAAHNDFSDDEDQQRLMKEDLDEL